MTDKELMQLALYALGLAKSSHNMVLSSDPPQSAWRYYDVDMKLQETITALDKRLAQPEQEPVAWANKEELGNIKNFDANIYGNGGFDDAVPLYTTPPQRPWVGLTDEEIKALSSWWPSYNQMPALMILARDIENLLKEKNT